MIASIISRYSLTLTDTVTVADYELALDADYDGKSQIVLHRKPEASEDDFIILNEGGIVFQGIIDAIENEKGQKAYTITAIEMQRLFDRKVILTNESLLSTGIEDFIADQITGNFISSDDALLNISYLTVTAKTHTPVAAKVDVEEGGIYNLCTYIGNALTSYGIFVGFEFEKDALNVVIEKRQQSDLKIDTGLANIINLSEIYETKALAKLTVLWNKGTTTDTRNFFLKTDRTITEDVNDPDRAKGSVNVIVSTAETEAEMKQAAYDQFAANSYQHKITFDVVPSKLVAAADLYVGHKLKVKTGSGIRDSIIAGIEHNNGQKAISVTLGQMKVTLIEKLKGVEAIK